MCAICVKARECVAVWPRVTSHCSRLELGERGMMSPAAKTDWRKAPELLEVVTGQKYRSAGDDFLRFITRGTSDKQNFLILLFGNPTGVPVFSCGCNNRHYTPSLGGDLMGFNLTPSYYDVRSGQKELSRGIGEGVTMTGRMIPSKIHQWISGQVLNVKVKKRDTKKMSWCNTERNDLKSVTFQLQSADMTLLQSDPSKHGRKMASLCSAFSSVQQRSYEQNCAFWSSARELLSVTKQFVLYRPTYCTQSFYKCWPQCDRSHRTVISHIIVTKLYSRSVPLMLSWWMRPLLHHCVLKPIFCVLLGNIILMTITIFWTAGFASRWDFSKDRTNEHKWVFLRGTSELAHCVISSFDTYQSCMSKCSSLTFLSKRDNELNCLRLLVG